MSSSASGSPEGSVPFRGTSPPKSYISYFDDKIPWTEERAQEIQERRALLNDELVFDTLLYQVGVRDADILFPPFDAYGLERLLSAIETSTYDQMKKDGLVYYLLKWREDNVAHDFMHERGIFPQFVILTDAYWELDAGKDINKAVHILSDSRLNRDYASKILQAIKHSPDPTPLIVKYIRTAKPVLDQPVDLDIYINALAETNFMEAWQFQRSFLEKSEPRERLLKKAIDWCFIPKPQTSAIQQLLALPMSSFEQDALHERAVHPPREYPAVSVTALQNLVCVRLIQFGRYADAIKLDRRYASKWHNQDRARMMADLHASLSPTERILLDMELAGGFGKGKPLLTARGSLPRKIPSPDLSKSISASWEEIRAPQPPPPLNASTLRSQNGRSNHAPMPPNPLLRNSLAASTSTPLSNSIVSMANGVAGRNPLAKSTGPVEPPLIPISSELPTQQPRKRFPALDASGLGASRLGKSANGIAGPSSLFASSSGKANAFYQPSAPAPTAEQDVEMNGADESIHADSDLEGGREQQQQQPPGDRSEMQVEDELLEYSIFDNRPPSVTAPKPNGTRRRSGRREPRPGSVTEVDTSSTKALPGGFMDVDEQPPAHTSPVQPAPSGKGTRRVTRRSNTNNLKKSMPGALSDDEDEEEDVEEKDELAPLPATSRTSAGRKGKAPIAASDVSSEDGDQPARRRSSRISRAPSRLEEASVSTIPKKRAAKKDAPTTSAPKTRKSTAKAATKKKRS